MTTETSNSPRYIIHVPDAWQRLISVIRHQASPGEFIYIDAPRQAGKTTFSAILKKKLALSDDLDCCVQQLHALSSYEQIVEACPKVGSKLPVIILDDADDIAPDTLEKLINQNFPFFWVILAEPSLIDRLPKLKNSKFTLPLFSKTDCHKLLNKLMKSEDINLDVPIMEAELIYYESRGNPKKIVAAAPKLLEKLQRRSINMDSFELANRGVLSTAVIAIGVLVFIAYVVFFSGDEPEQTINADQSAQQAISGDNGSETSGELIIQQPTDFLDGKQNSTNANTEQGSLSINSQQEGASDKHETGELLLGDSGANSDVGTDGAISIKPMSFEDWLALQNPKHFTIQIYSNQDLNKVKQFASEHKLDNSHHYSVMINGSKVYRLVWGDYQNRARAQLAIKQLPEKLQQQKPWIRSFGSIAKELKN